MPYTLLKFLIWGAVFFLAGGLIGWLLRSLRSRAEVAAARRATTDADDVERMRHRLANLESVVAERDQLRSELAARARSSRSMGEVGAPDDGGAPIAGLAANGDDTIDEPIDTDPTAEAGTELAVEVPAVERTADSAGDAATTTDDLGAHADEVSADDAPTETEPDDAQADPVDLDAAAAALGRSIELDDLTVVEGIGPKIATLCAGIGIATWRELADTEVSLLRTMLRDAGSRYKVHDPTSWPEQAALLARGDWQAFATLTDELDGGR